MSKTEEKQSYYTKAYEILPAPSFNGELYTPETSLLDVIKDKTLRATNALGYPEEQQKSMLQLIEDIWGKYSHYRVGEPPFHSFGAKEGTPVEFQLCWDNKGPSFRFGSDSYAFNPISLAFDPSPESSKAEFYKTTRKISNYEGVDCDDSIAMEKYFQSVGTFGVGGHVVQWRKGGNPSFKIYFINRPDEEHNLESALKHLNVIEPWEAIKAHFKKMGLSKPQCGALSLDMKDSKISRVKLYVAHEGHSAKVIDETSSIASNYKAGAFEKALKVITGKSSNWENPPVTYFSFFPGEKVPSASLIFIPLIPNLENDAMVMERCREFLEEEDTNQKEYVKGYVEAFQAFSHKPLEKSKTLNFLAYIPGKQFSLNIGPGIFDSI